MNTFCGKVSRKYWVEKLVKKLGGKIVRTIGEKLGGGESERKKSKIFCVVGNFTDSVYVKYIKIH